MKRFFILFYSLLCYILGLTIILYYIGFLAGILVPKTINSGSGSDFYSSLAINLLLLIMFGLQHSVMARKSFKNRYKSYFPASTIRSTYILLSSIILGVVIWLWQPMPQVLVEFTETWQRITIYTLYGVGWFVGIFSTFLIDHFDLFGLKQAWSHWKGENQFQYQFRTPLLYKLVRHPIYLGWFMIHWFTPVLTLGHILYATVITIYIYIAISYEEQDLVDQFGDEYIEYKKTTPKLIPYVKK